MRLLDSTPDDSGVVLLRYEPTALSLGQLILKSGSPALA
jgi:hypothetical protein